MTKNKQETLLQLAEKHQLSSLAESIKDNQQDLQIAVGILGEFSTGKSTLINSLLGKPLLPAMERPTTKNVVEIEPRREVSKNEFYALENNELLKITAAEFSDRALGNVEGKSRIVIPEQGLLQQGYLVVDTPGLSSLDQMDADITCGYLPFLDVVVICLDIQQGSLTESIVNFLNRREVKAIGSNFLFVITRSDTKPPEVISNIKNNIIEQLKGLDIVRQGKMSNIEKRVVTVSAQKALEEKDNSPISEFIDVFTAQVLQRKQDLTNHRIDRQLNLYATEMEALLTEKRNSLKFDDRGIRQRQSELNRSMEKVKADRSQAESKLNKLQDVIRGDLQQICQGFIPTYKESSSDNLSEITHQLLSKISANIDSTLQTYFKDLDLSAINVESLNQQHVDGCFLHSIQSNFATREVVSSVGLTAIGIAGTLLTGGLAEVAIGGATLASLATTKAVKGVVAKGIAGQAAKGVAAKAAFQGLAEIVKAVNPVDWVATWIGKNQVESTVTAQLPVLANRIAHEVYSETTKQLEINLFMPLEDHLNDLRQMLEKTYQEREDQEQDIQEKLDTLRDDLQIITEFT